MQVKLRQVGNSVGVTIPNSELKRMDAAIGDIVEIEIIRVVRNARADWDKQDRWSGADQEPLLLDALPSPEFDKEWQW
jgi:antitoxin component of MazEF toxin-antitoxin module